VRYTNGKNKNIRGLSKVIKEFKSDYQPINNLIKHKNGDLLADSLNILNMWKNYFPQLIVHNVNDVGEIEVHVC
jgi:hypothetical protein